MHLKHWICLCLLPSTILAGCASGFRSFTENYRSTIGDKDLHTLVLRVSTPIQFKSMRELDPVPEKEKNLFSSAGYRYHEVSDTTSGRVIGQGDGWITVDFGGGIVLTFNRRPADGVYAMPGWGTHTIQGERYDIVMGVLSGTDVELGIKD